MARGGVSVFAEKRYLVAEHVFDVEGLHQDDDHDDEGRCEEDAGGSGSDPAEKLGRDDGGGGNVDGPGLDEWIDEVALQELDGPVDQKDVQNLRDSKYRGHENCRKNREDRAEVWDEGAEGGHETECDGRRDASQAQAEGGEDSDDEHHDEAAGEPPPEGSPDRVQDFPGAGSVGGGDHSDDAVHVLVGSCSPVDSDKDHDESVHDESKGPSEGIGYASDDTRHSREQLRGVELGRIQ